jgi:hypothetical protein
MGGSSDRHPVFYGLFLPFVKWSKSTKQEMETVRKFEGQGVPFSFQIQGKNVVKMTVKCIR